MFLVNQFAKQFLTLKYIIWFSTLIMFYILYHISVNRFYYNKAETIISVYNNLDISYKHFVLSNKKLVIVFVHIQKSGGTFIEHHLTRHGIIDLPCHCGNKKFSCKCFHEDRFWLFSRFNTGWPCGLHADFTELNECVPKKVDELENSTRPRIYAYFTVLRDPVSRYLSEWLHVIRGATWENAKLSCRNRRQLPSEYKICFTNQTTSVNISLDAFFNCPFNLASNRQTRMLASLASLGCYAHLHEWTSALQPGSPLFPSQAALVESAKINIATRLAVFGLIGRLGYTQYAYQSTFGIVFQRIFQNPNEPLHVSYVVQLSAEHNTSLPSGWLEKVNSFNRLDQLLFEFAEDLFARRLTAEFIRDSRLPRWFRLVLKSVHRDPKKLLFNYDFQRRAEQKILFKLFKKEERKRKKSLNIID